MNAKQRNGMTKSILLNLKRLVLGGGKMIAALLCCAAIQAYAIEFTATGVVEKIFALDKIVYGVDKSHILIGGLSVAGTCPTNDGLIASRYATMTAGDASLVSP